MDIPQQKPTGETFFMREPDLRFDASLDCHQAAAYWDRLFDTIKRCGGKVVYDSVEFPNQSPGQRDRIYPRDPLIVLTEGDAAYVCPTRRIADGWGDEANEIVAQLKKQPHVAFGPMIDGNIEGGNLVADASRGMMFLGVNNSAQAFYQSFGTAPDYHSLEGKMRERGVGHDKDLHSMLHQQRCHYAKDEREWIEDASDPSKRGSLKDGNMPYRLITLFMKDEYAQDFYHLDGAFNVLPSGEAVVCREVFGRAALHRIDNIFGDRQIEVSLEDACKGACNFITVGNHVIVPHSPSDVGVAMEKLGYDVITPERIGLPEGAWLFSEMAGPRCATLKISPDKGFPEQEKSRGVEAAASVLSR